MQPSPLPWYITILTSIPQTFLVVRTGFQLFNLHINNSRLLMLSLIMGIIAIFVRKLPFMFGVHTIILIVASSLLAAIVTGAKLWHCLVTILAGALILGVLEDVLLPIFLNLTAATADILTLKPWVNMLYFLPQGIIMAVIYFLAKKRNYVIFDLSLDRE